MRVLCLLLLIATVYKGCDATLDKIKAKISEIDGLIKQMETDVGSGGVADGIKTQLSGISTQFGKEYFMEGIQAMKTFVGATYDNDTLDKIKDPLKNLGIKADEMIDLFSEKLDTDVDAAMKKLSLTKFPDADLTKVEPLGDKVKAVVTSFGKTQGIPAEIQTIINNVVSYFDKKDLLNGIKEGKKINKTYLKKFDTLSAEQVSLLDDFEGSILALQDGINKQLAARVTAKNGGLRMNLGPHFVVTMISLFSLTCILV